MRNEKREIILLSVFLGNIYMTNLCKEWCCDRELKGRAWNWREGGSRVIYLLMYCMYCQVCFGGMDSVFKDIMEFFKSQC